MKRIFLIGILSIASVVTHAKSGAECRQELQSVLSFRNGKYLAEQQGGVPEIADCKNVQYSGVNNKVYLTADKSALIVQNNTEQSLSLSLIPGFVTDYAVMAGRLIISTADKKVLVVGRNGFVFEMLTSSGKSYADVKSIAIKNGVLEMEQNSNAPIHLTEEQVTRRVNEPGKFRSISF